MDVLSRSASLGNASSSGSTEGDMLQRAKKLLQSTLLKSTLGGSELECLCLRLPRLPTEISNVEDIRIDTERYGREWLLETLWGLIGWDMVT